MRIYKNNKFRIKLKNNCNDFCINSHFSRYRNVSNCEINRFGSEISTSFMLPSVIWVRTRQQHI